MCSTTGVACFCLLKSQLPDSCMVNIVTMLLIFYHALFWTDYGGVPDNQGGSEDEIDDTRAGIMVLNVAVLAQ